ncbi:ParA family protein [Sinomonas sp. ASV322]|uniref:MinD/ParA family ATP-binding protein n=1 Tax=Sinomonas sp. ASV322 TaxID=3041920 RepID=UPI0027DDD9BA|nr:ParA family protein [Sinomonas sp. ASV322]MDQ4503401.1 ParA family protein [Sinomonas sp. ASV322]
MTQINARLSANGEAQITGSNGRTWNTSYADLEAARQSVQETAAATAAAIDSPVQLVISDPAGEQRMLVFASGEAEVDGAHAAAAAEPAPMAAPAHVGTPAQAARPGGAAAEPARPAAPPSSFAPAEGEARPGSAHAAFDGAEPPLRRRRPTAADFAASRPSASQSPAQEGWQGAVNGLSGGALRLSPGAHEVERREWRASAQRGLAGHKTVVFVNLKGGASKTTSCYLAAATLGRVRGGNVLAWDNNENKGTLGDRAMAASHDHTAIDLLANVERFASPSNAHELVNYVRPQGENKFHVLASQNQAGDKEVIDGAAFVQLHSVLRQFYHLALVDTGNASTAGTWQAAVEIADEIVLVAMNKEDSSKTLAATVDTLVEMGFADKLARGVLLVTQPPVPSKNRKTRVAANEERLNRIREHFGHYVRQIVIAPYDEALDDGADIIFENLSPSTQEAYLEATAAIVDGL